MSSSFTWFYFVNLGNPAMFFYRLEKVIQSFNYLLKMLKIKNLFYKKFCKYTHQRVYHSQTNQLHINIVCQLNGKKELRPHSSKYGESFLFALAFVLHLHLFDAVCGCVRDYYK